MSIQFIAYPTAIVGQIRNVFDKESLTGQFDPLDSIKLLRTVGQNKEQISATTHRKMSQICCWNVVLLCLDYDFLLHG